MISRFCFNGFSFFPKAMSVFFIEEWIQRWSQIAEHGGGDYKQMELNTQKSINLQELTSERKYYMH